MRFAASIPLLAALLLAPLAAIAAPGDALTVPAVVQMQPAELAAMLKAGNVPPILQVGFNVLNYKPENSGVFSLGPSQITGKRSDRIGER